MYYILIYVGMLTVVMGLSEVVCVQGMVVLIHRAIYQVLWIIAHQLSDPGQHRVRGQVNPAAYWSAIQSIGHKVDLWHYIQELPIILNHIFV